MTPSALVYSLSPVYPFEIRYARGHLPSILDSVPAPGLEALFDLIHPEDSQRRQEQLFRLAEHSEGIQLYRVKDVFGAYRWVWEHLRFVPDGQGQPLEIQGTLLLLHAREPFQGSGEHSGLRAEHLTRAAADHALTVRVSEGRPADTVHACTSEVLTGYASRELAGDFGLWAGIIHPEDRAQVLRRIEIMVRDRVPEPLEYRLLCKNGAIRWVLCLPVLRFTANGELGAFDLLLRDISRRRQMESEMRWNYQLQSVQKSLLQLAVERLSMEQMLQRCCDLILSVEWLKSPGNAVSIYFERADDGTLELMAASLPQHRIRSIKGVLPASRGLVPKSSFVAGEAVGGECMESFCPLGGPHFHLSVPLFHGETRLGAIFLCLARTQPLQAMQIETLSSIGDVVAGVVSRKKTEDELLRANALMETMVSERTNELKKANRRLAEMVKGLKRTESELARSVSLLGATFDSIIQGLLVVGHEGEIDHFNHRFVELWGIPPQLLETKDDRKLVQFVLGKLSQGRRFVARLKQLRDKPGVEFFETLQCRDGRVIELCTRPRMFRGRIIGRIWICWDVTEQKDLEERLGWTAAVNAGMANLSRALLSQNSFKTISQMVLEYALRLTESPDGFVVRRQQDGNMDFYSHNPSGQGFGAGVDWILSKGEMLLCNHGVSIPGLNGQRQGDREIRRILFAPAMADGELVGSLGVMNSGRDYDDRHQMVIERMANLYALALERMEARQELEARTLEMEEMAEAVLEQNEKVQLINHALVSLGEARSLRNHTQVLLDILHNEGLDPVVLGVPWAEGKDLFLSKGLDEIRLSSFRKWILESAPARKAWQEGMPVTSRNWTGPVPAWASRIGRHWAVHPLKGKEAVIGVVLMAGERYHETDAIQLLLAQGSVFLENAILLEGMAEINSKLSIANEKLINIDRQKTDFLNVVAHDLRTPLTSIRSYAELLLMYRDESHEVRDEFLNIIKKESDRLANLINDFLDVARIESGNMKYVSEPYLLQDLLEHHVAVFRGETVMRQIDIRLHLPEQLPILVGDPNRIGQVLANLLSNAVKFSPEGGTIHVTAVTSRRPQGVSVSVRDEGVGIAPEHHEKIFEKFGQVDGVESRAKGGTGLGLSISRQIIEHHGGSIQVESEPGKGACFRFFLPRPDLYH